MFYIADLHVHSHYARATSKNLNLHTLYQWAQIKGIDVVATGDFTHPAWFKTLQATLQPDGNGFYVLTDPPQDGGLPGIQPTPRQVRFCLGTEISCVYSYKGKMRKSHHLVYAPDFATVARINARLGKIGNLAADGRPILGLPARDLLEIVLESSPRSHLIPAHIWTPWFSIFGSKSGYDSLQACFRDLTPYIFALETGLSSDPAMNWRLGALDAYAMVSNSDAHSPANLGREVTLFDTDLTYDALFAALQTKKGFAGTLEFFPQEGKYYLDGHRSCQICWYPSQTKQEQGKCPVCGRQLTVGVLHRVEGLADRGKPQQPKLAPDFQYIVPLPEIIAQIVQKGVKTQTVQKAFIQIINQFGHEFAFLREVPLAAIEKHLGKVYAGAINRLRKGQVVPTPGYDGCYGIIDVVGKPATQHTQQTVLSL